MIRAFYLSLMKAQVILSLSDQQLRALLSTLSIEDCTYAIRFLQGRLEQYNAEKAHKSVSCRTLGPQFLDRLIEEFELTNRTRLHLKRNCIHTVRDLTEVGVDKLMTFRGFGRGTIREIKRIVFEQEVHDL